MTRVVAALILLLSCLVAAPVAGAQSVSDHEGSELHRTLAFQYRLGSALPLRDAPWIGTHNSFNTITEPRTLSGEDPNQQLSLGDQLRLDVRSLELDAHYIPTLRAGGRKAVVLCHGRPASERHAGCTSERLMTDRLQEIRGWLEEHPDQVLLLYLEDHLEDAAGFGEAARAFESILGPDLYRPPATGACAPMPLDVTRRQVRAAGAQVLVISSCGPDGTAWRGVAFDDADRELNERQPEGFAPYPTCDGERDEAYYDAHFIRYYEDSTRFGASAGTARGRLTPEITREMDRCGVDSISFDQLVPGDPRLEALRWSWAEGQPRSRPGGTCAVQYGDGRWRTNSCIRRRPFACMEPEGGWTVDDRRAPFREARRRCPGPARFALPRSAEHAQDLLDAMDEAGVSRAWVSYRR